MHIPVHGAGLLSPLGKNGEAVFRRGEYVDSNSDNYKNQTSFVDDQHLLLKDIPGITGEFLKLGSRAGKLAIAASYEALKSIGTERASLRRTGIIIGTTLMDLSALEKYLTDFRRKGAGAFPPWALHYGLPLSHASHTAVVLGLGGSCETLNDNVNSGLDAIGMAYRALLNGEQEAFIAGGVESPSGSVFSCLSPDFFSGMERNKSFAEGGAVFLLGSSDKEMPKTGKKKQKAAYICGYRNAFGDEKVRNFCLEKLAKEAFCDRAGIDLLIETEKMPFPLPQSLSAGPALGFGMALSVLCNNKKNCENPGIRNIIRICRANETLYNNSDLRFRNSGRINRIIVASTDKAGKISAIALLSPDEDSELQGRSFSRKDSFAVVTGIGVASPIGSDFPSFAQGLKTKKTGIISWNDPQVKEVKVAAPVSEIPHDEKMPRSTRLLLCAVREALSGSQSGRNAKHGEHDQNIGLYAGETLSSVNAWISLLGQCGGWMRKAESKMENNSKSELGCKSCALPDIPDALRKEILFNSPAWIMQETETGGEILNFASGCTGGLFAIGRAARDVCLNNSAILAGGTDSTLGPFALGALSRARLLSTCDDPEKAGRPFDAERDGEVTAEGSAVLMLERTGIGENMDERALAVISGFGAMGDAYHFKYNKPDGEALVRTIQAALDSAGISADRIDLVIAHASGFKGSDAIEIKALRHIFEALPYPPVISIKGAIGQPFSAGGPLQVAAAVAALKYGFIPPTAHFYRPDDDDSFDHVPEPVQLKTPLKHVLITSYGYGGGKAAMIISHPSLFFKNK